MYGCSYFIYLFYINYFCVISLLSVSNLELNGRKIKFFGLSNLYFSEKIRKILLLINVLIIVWNVLLSFVLSGVNYLNRYGNIVINVKVVISWNNIVFLMKGMWIVCFSDM